MVEMIWMNSEEPAMDSTEEPRPADQLVITDLETLKVISDPLRIRIVDLLRQAPATVKALASRLQLTPRSLYYHINLLERHGLVRVVSTRLVSGILEKRYQATAYLFMFKDIEKSAGGAQGTEAMMSSFLRITDEEIRDSLRAGRLSLDMHAPVAARLTWNWHLLELPPERAEEFAGRLERLIEEYQAPPAAATPPDETRTYRLLCTFFPTYRRGPRGEDTGSLA
jgi:DNA-binding transcriptional ArsR family regulator